MSDGHSIHSQPAVDDADYPDDLSRTIAEAGALCAELQRQAGDALAAYFAAVESAREKLYSSIDQRLSSIESSVETSLSTAAEATAVGTAVNNKIAEKKRAISTLLTQFT